MIDAMARISAAIGEAITGIAARGIRLAYGISVPTRRRSNLEEERDHAIDRVRENVKDLQHWMSEVRRIDAEEERSNEALLDKLFSGGSNGQQA